MIEIEIEYQGHLHCSAVHGPSGTRLETDAPVDNNGRGESFSPTDLAATALGSCVLTIMGIKARDKGLDMAGATVRVGKHMTTEAPRRIGKLELTFVMPLAADHPQRPLLEAVAASCPVRLSLHPDIEVVTSWEWIGA